MTTIRPADLPVAPTPPFRLPDIPEKTPYDMTTANAIHLNIRSYLLGPPLLRPPQQRR